jgi:hypothetical protein
MEDKGFCTCSGCQRVCLGCTYPSDNPAIGNYYPAIGNLCEKQPTSKITHW